MGGRRSATAGLPAHELAAGLVQENSMSLVPYTPKPGSASARVIAYLQTPPSGTWVSTPELTIACSIPRGDAAGTLSAPVRNGAVLVRHGKSRWDPSSWSLGKLKTAQPMKIVLKPPAPKKKALTVIPKAHGRLAPDLPVVNPKNVKPTICPSALDTRYKADPSFTGGYLAEWRRLRGEA